MIATTHKFNLLPLFDEILVMEDGKLVERGALSELIAAGRQFSELWGQYAGASSSPKQVAAL